MLDSLSQPCTLTCTSQQLRVWKPWPSGRARSWSGSETSEGTTVRLGRSHYGLSGWQTRICQQPQASSQSRPHHSGQEPAPRRQVSVTPETSPFPDLGSRS